MNSLREKSGSVNRRPTLFFFGCIAAALVCLTGCGTVHRRNPVPEKFVQQAQPLGYSHIRGWGDESSLVLLQSMATALHQQATNAGETSASIAATPMSILALSGGGMNGAFGAGFLCGWTEHGTRPRFDLVTGISAGALLAPFAFAGPEHDAEIRAIYDHLRPDEIFRKKNLLRLLRGDSFYDSTPLQQLLERHVTTNLLAKIGREHAKGRRLWIGTANLDACRPVIWDMGAIAASGHEDALELFRDVLLASASIPGAFPPVYLPVEVDGQKFDEMHVDGGVGFQVFGYGPTLMLGEHQRLLGNKPRPAKLYILRNGDLHTHYRPVKPKFGPIVLTSLHAMTHRQALGDFYRMFALAGRDHIDFNLAGIPPEHWNQGTALFDADEMVRLFKLGHDLSSRGYKWFKAPPEFVTE